MKNSSGSEEAKRRAGESAAELVDDGDVVGLGTGSTAAYAVERLGERVDSGLDVQGIPTSLETRRLAIQEDLPLTSLQETSPDIAVDGADAYTRELDLVKGGGAAHTREKVVAESSERFVAVVDDSKQVDAFGVVPIEVVEHARPLLERRLREMDAEPIVRECEGKDGAVVTDDGNPVVDADFGKIEDTEAVAAELDGITGVVEHGLFLGLADEIHVGYEDDVKVLER